ncbi:26S proteasome regulatory subunit N13 [Emericellopsis cladophorae]|uniref:26S proteasome regulatory subunit N13 n=1 Tax=Emericellopsis cladophorae TaxID=2686198 RepID=A0A9P9Y934_9HYPO|nr:26S proteasome regulatory subunit N13 [Emericellopsis cladophorae]KAI6785643.1 26S proteasome regulatory subunit N13 [Emericellopsis cladophorae]
MATAPIITFKAGQCDLDTSSKPFKVKPQAQPGYIYLYSEDDLIHFCWRRRDASLTDPELDLVMVPTDGSFVPYEHKTSPQPTAKTNGRIFALKFASSSQRHLFWLQSKPQSQNGDESWFSPRDRKIGEIVNSLLQGEEVDVTRELANVRGSNNQPDDDDDDEDMEDAEPSLGHRASGGGGAGADATGGDVREEGESSREGGADGARAGPAGDSDASEAVRNLLSSLAEQPGLSGGQSQTQDKPYPHLSHLLPTFITVAMVDYIAANDPARLDSFLSFLPPSVLVLSGPNPEASSGNDEPAAAEVEKAKAAMSHNDKKALLKKVLRSPQFFQALGVLTQALRDGGLPGVADALGIRVENGGYLPNGTMPLGGGQAIEAFVEGVKKTVGGQ